MVPFATATDGGGSIRIPASFCGLFGIKPTNGLVGRDPIPAWMDYSTDGPIGLSMADLRLLLAVECGPAPGDPAALPADLGARLAGLADVTAAAWLGEAAGFDIRFGHDLPAARKPSLVLAAPRFVEAGAAAGRAAGPVRRRAHEPGAGPWPDRGRPAKQPVEIFGGGRPDDDWLLTCICEQAAQLGREVIDADAALFEPSFLAAMREGLGTSVDVYLAARRRRFDYARRLDELLGEDRVLVTPTNAVEGIYADGREIGAKTEAGTRSRPRSTPECRT